MDDNWSLQYTDKEFIVAWWLNYYYLFFYVGILLLEQRALATLYYQYVIYHDWYHNSYAGILQPCTLCSDYCLPCFDIYCYFGLAWLGLAWLADSSVGGIPRSVHLNLLPIITATFLIFHREGIYLRLVLPILGIIIFLALALNVIPHLSIDLVVPSERSVAGLWFNHITGIVGNGIVIAKMQVSMNARSVLERDMRQGIIHGDYFFQYQPQVDVNGRIIGVEALLRWQHPKKGSVSPLEFIPLAEETGLIVPLGEWGLRTACCQLAEWRQSPLTKHLTIAVNVSAIQFRQPNFVQEVKNILLFSDADPSKLKLELTETALVDDVDVAIKKMTALKEIGVAWSLDDFGTGFSSLNLLKRLPLEQLKIDKSFVNDLLIDNRSLSIVNTIINLSQNLSLTVIAEGVENENQLMKLSSMGCKIYQGYFFSRPLVISELNKIIISSNGSIIT